MKADTGSSIRTQKANGLQTVPCELCGLEVRRRDIAAEYGQNTLYFCCNGCHMVYAMLMEAADAPDPSRFKESELYQRCLAAGVVPAGPQDLARFDQETAAASESVCERAGSNGDHYIDLHYRVQGMWCPACAWVIQDALTRMPGVDAVVCDFAIDRLRCRFDPIRTTPEHIRQLVARLGYRLVSDDPAEDKAGWRHDFIRLVVSGLLSANVMMLSWALYSGFFTSLGADDIAFISWPIAAMATVVLIYGGGPISRKAWRGLVSGAPGMETLIVLAAASAYGYSLVNLWAGSLHLYFDTAAMLITLLLLGKTIENHAKNRVRRDLESFLSLQPKKVRLCTDAHPEGRFVSIEQLGVGDCFKVAADEVVPADGRVRRGRGRLDASAITGEPQPVTVRAGDPVTSGSRVLDGPLVIETLRVGDDALLGQMIALVRQGLARRTDLETRTDRWLNVFVPLMIVLAACTGIAGYSLGLTVHQALIRAVTVLVIACPCALGIAIPLARVAGIARAGRNGILVRDFESFERAPGMDTIVFDKTGTLTHGRWRLTCIERHTDLTDRQVVSLAAGLERGSNHVVARSVLAYAAEQGIAPETALQDVRIGLEGVCGTFEGRIIRIGNRTFARGAEPAAGKTVLADPSASSSCVYLSMDGQLAATLHFGDAMRPHMRWLIRQLKASGYHLHLLSGDSQEATAAVAVKLKIDQAHGGLLPQYKAAYIESLQQGGHRVIMVGDGINDAPALAQSDLAVAVHSGAPLARESAAVTLMGADPRQLLDFLARSRQVNSKVAQNLWCAFAYNLISIPVAMSGLLTPLIALAAMLLSSLSVIGNTVLLVRHPNKNYGNQA